MRTKLRGKFTLLFVLCAVLLAIPAVALADIVANNADASIDATVESKTIAAGATTSVGYFIQVQGGGNDGQGGCNASDSTPAKVTINTPADVTVTPGSLTFNQCGVVQNASFTSQKAGTYNITVGLTDSGAGTYSVQEATWSLTVTPPPDSTPPVITKDVTGTLGANGWYTSNVGVDWTVTDGESAISSQSGCADFNVTSDQGATNYTCIATSAGGSSSNSVSIKRDATAPTTIQWSGGPNAGSESAFGSVPNEPTCSATDATSGMHTCVVSGYSNAVGTHTMTATATDKAGNKSTATRTYTVDKAATTTTVTCDAGPFTYNGSAHEPCSASVSGPGLNNQSVPVSYTNNTNAGTATASASYAGSDNYQGSQGSKTFTIDKANAVIDVNGYTGTYDGQAHGATGTAEGVGGADLSNLLDLGASFTNVPGGTANWSFAGNDNHKAASGSVAISIDKAATTTTVTCTGGPFTYTGSAITPCSATVTGPGGLDQALTVDYTNNTNAGTATASASYAGTGNYAGSTGSKDFTIAKADQKIDFAEIGNKTYGDADFKVSATGGNSGEAVAFAADGNCTVSGVTVHITGAGSCTVTASQAGNANYNAATSVPQTFAIARATTTTTVTCDAGPFTYNGSAHEPCSASVSGPGLDQALTVSYKDNVDAGTATASASYAGSANYLPSQGSKTFTIEKRAITVTADAQSKTYGDADPALTYKVTTGSLANANDLSGSLTRVAGQDVGTYAIQQGTLSANSNYSFTFVGADFTITKRAIGVTAANKTKVYGEADPALTYTITSGTLAAGDSLSGALSRAPGQDVGTYAIQQGTLSANSNYSFTFVGADFTITKRAITVTADSHTKLLGAADPALTYKVTSGLLVAGDSFSGALTRTPGETVAGSPYAIKQGTLSLGNNYNLAFVDGTLRIIYRFDGFRPPVDNPGTGATPVFNSAKAGQSIPMKFSLSGNQGLGIIAAGYPKVTAVACPNSTAAVDAIEEYATVTANNGLTYDATADQYNYVWKTQSTFANKCYKFDMVLTDGTSHMAYFKFLK